MTRRYLSSTIIALVGLFLGSSSAVSEKLSVNLTTYQVAIRSNFTGATITLFGAIQNTEEIAGATTERPKPYDVIVVVRGPDDDVTVRRKERTAGIWINRAAVTFKQVPGFYFVASTRPLSEIVSEPLLNRNEIGTRHLSLTQFTPEIEGLSPEDIDRFREAIVRQRKENQLYVEAEGQVLLQDNTLFSMNVSIPANVPVGDYIAQVLLVRDGTVVGSQSLRPSVNKFGLERVIYRFAHDMPFFYGITAVLVAIFAGWLASAAFRRR